MSEVSKCLVGLLQRAPLPQLSALASRHPAPVLLVGGAIRDGLLGRKPGDFDLVITAEFRRFLDRITTEFGRRANSIGDRFQETHRLLWRGIQVDVTRLQGDARVAMDQGDAIELDLRRRDFTINAMALRLGAEHVSASDLLDPCGGIADLASARIRCTTVEALDADPLRLMRAVRYAHLLAGFEIEPATRRAIIERADMLAGVAGERVRQEWMALLSMQDWASAVETAYDLGAGEVTLGFASDLASVREWSRAEMSGAVVPSGQGATLRLAALCLDLIRGGLSAVCVERSLRHGCWPRRLAQEVVTIADWAKRLGDTPHKELVEWALQDPSAARKAARLAAPCTTREAAERLQLYAARAEEERWVRGSDLCNWGLSEGPELGRVLREAARGQVERRWSSALDCRDWVRRRASEVP